MKTFEIPVVRVGYGFATITVEADTQERAEELALDEAGDHEFSEKSAEYDLEGGSIHDDHPLVNQAIEQIKKDILDGDATALAELLTFVPKKNLEGFLPEKGV